jgi:hypothetical protein
MTHPFDRLSVHRPPECNEPDPIGTEPGDTCNRYAEPDFGQTLTSEAEMFNAPRHLGKSLYGATTGDDSEILPTSKPNLRPAKGR